ncbi:MAG TPA: glycosyltransferase family 39 protein [Deltaproteobacteria bacterium]|nr:glycosyltransferase family 39 protein [Deltaproteobacteria bacterium]
MNLKIDRQILSDICRVVLVAVLFTGMAVVIGRPEVRAYLFDIDRMREALQGGWGGRSRLISAALFVLIWGGLVAAGIPRLWASAIGGIIYGAFMGTVLSLIASLLGSSILYGAGASMLAGVVERRMGITVKLWRARFQENAFWWVLYCRLFPFSKSTLTSLLCGSCRVSFRSYTLGSLLGFIPLAVVFATFGSGGVKGNLWQIGLATMLLVLSVLARRLLSPWFPVTVNDSRGRCEMPGRERAHAIHFFRALPGPARMALAVMALLAFSLSFQGSRGLWERDEGRYTNIALQMLDSGDFIVPAFNNGVPHFAKPPLTYWAIAGGMRLLGRNEWGARLPNALAFIATVMVVYALARRITPGRPWLPPIVYATSLFPFGAANVITTDTLLTLWESMAVLGFVEWRHRHGAPGRQHSLLVMWGGFGLAFLTKGPPGLLPLLAIVVFVISTDGLKTIPRLLSPAGMAAFFAIGFGWYVLVGMTHQGLMTYFIRDEFVNRIATGMHHRNPQWYKPVVIYLPVLIAGTFPWTFPLFGTVRSVRRTLLSGQWWMDRLANDQWPLFLILWVLLPLAVFFASSSRLPLYILPLFVPLALVTGRVAGPVPHRKEAACLLALWIAVLPAVKGAAAFFPYEKDSRTMAEAICFAVHPVPREIVFIDSEPFWGLSLYLNREINRISTQGETRTEGLLSEEVSEWEPGLLYVAEKSHLDRIREACGKLGFSVDTLGGHGSWIFLKLAPA